MDMGLSEPTDIPIVGDPAPVDAPAALDATIEAPVVIEPADEPVVETPIEAPAESVIEGAAELPVEEVAGEGEQAEAPADDTPTFPSYEDWTLPEGLTMQPEQTEAYNELIGRFGLDQEKGQEMIAFGGEILKQAQERMAEQQVEVFNQTRQGWVKDFEKQAGNQRNTILNDAKSAIKDAVPDEKARADVWNVLAYTGAGDNPAIINMLAALGKRNRERGAPGPSLTATGTQNPADKRYGRRS
jgi:hypothetical protein